MPPFLEGDRQVTLDFVRFNVEHLVEVVEEGYDIVCSCPTCSYMLRTVLGEGAYFSKDYQDLAGGNEKAIKVPVKRRLGEHGDRKLKSFSKTIYKGIFKDDGYFSAISPLKRIKVAENTYDPRRISGLSLQKWRTLDRFRNGARPNGLLSTLSSKGTGDRPALCRTAQRHTRHESGGDQRCFLLLRPGRRYGFKRDFMTLPFSWDAPLMEKLRTVNPDRIVTDCLSCRLQFNQLLRYEVVHPIEVLKESYAGSKLNQTKAVSAGN